MKDEEKREGKEAERGREGCMLNRSAWRQLYARPLSPIYDWTPATSSSTSETKERVWTDPLPSPTSSVSITPSASIHPPLYCDPNNGPSRVKGFGPGPRLLSFSLPPSRARAPPWEHLPSLVCVSLMNRLLTVVRRESRWDSGKIYSTRREREKRGKRAVKLQRGVQNALSKCSSGRQNPKYASYLHIFPIYLLLN